MSFRVTLANVAAMAKCTPGYRRVSRAVTILSFILLASCRSDELTLPAAGDWRVINYWAIWCTPCREEIPELNSLNRLSDVTVLGVNFDGKLDEDLATQASTLGISFENLTFDPGPMLGVARPQALPVTVLVNPEGKKTAVLVGPQTEASLIDALAKSGRSTASKKAS